MPSPSEQPGRVPRRLLRLDKMARRPGAVALLAFAAAPWLLAGFAPVPPLNRHASARRRNVQINVETESRTEQPTKRRRRNGVRRRNNGEQRNGEPQPVNGKSEGRSLSVIASSVMALGVLPGAEIKLILENLCASLPPDEFKAFLLAIGANLAPQYHKNICYICIFRQ